MIIAIFTIGLKSKVKRVVFIFHRCRHEVPREVNSITSFFPASMTSLRTTALSLGPHYTALPSVRSAPWISVTVRCPLYDDVSYLVIIIAIL